MPRQQHRCNLPAPGCNNALDAGYLKACFIHIQRALNSWLDELVRVAISAEEWAVTQYEHRIQKLKRIPITAERWARGTTAGGS